ncbi:MAG: hypothetical protein EBR09_15430 [Proteobacteria bacterium]|nr:hypothetical protein [Pseudomonadota bacterium]
MTSKSKGSSIRQKLIALSRSLRIPQQNLETSFLIERLVALVTLVSYTRNLLSHSGTLPSLGNAVPICIKIFIQYD